MKARLGILATHPIQYHAPLFRVLATSMDIAPTVYFAHRPTPAEQGSGFGVPFEWDIDLLSGYTHVWLKNRSRGPFGSFNGCDTPEIRDIIRKERFDLFLVLGWNSRCYWQAMSACWREGVPVSVRGDSQLRKKNSPPVRLAKRIAYPFFMRRFSSCLAVGSRSAEYFAHYGARRVIASPHFVDNERFAAESGKERAAGGIRKSWNIPGDRAVLLFAGKMIDWKRPMDALLALRSLIAGGGRYHLLMAGDGPARKACEAFAARHRLPVTFTGFLNQSCMPGVYATADALVLPSEARETWGLVVNEAMACGVPAVVSDEAGCVPDLIREGETGFSYACGDVAALAAAMRRTAASREISGRMGHEARRHVAAFSAEAAAGGVRKALEAARRER